MPHSRYMTPPCLRVSPSVMVWAAAAGAKASAVRPGCTNSAYARLRRALSKKVSEYTRVIFALPIT